MTHSGNFDKYIKGITLLRKASRSLVIGLVSLWLTCTAMAATPHAESYCVEGRCFAILRGTAFGSPPKIEIYDDFEHAGATAGDVVRLNDAIVGSWTEMPDADALYANEAASGSLAFLAWDNSRGRTRKLRKTFDRPVQSVFVSYKVKLGSNSPFPGKRSEKFGGFSPNSSWKFAWLVDADYQGRSSDLAIPTYVGKGTAAIAGNDLMLTYLAKPKNWWSWTGFTRISVLLAADKSAPTTSGRVIFTAQSSDHGLYVLDKKKPVFDDDGPTTKQYTRITFPGWIHSFPNRDGAPLYDDIYVASGPNAYARIELTDRFDYARANNTEILVPIEWRHDCIIAELKTPLTARSNNVPTIHLFDSSGKRRSTELIRGSSSRLVESLDDVIGICDGSAM